MPLAPVISPAPMAVATIAGPGCTNTEGTKSLISAPWPAMAPAKTASASAARAEVPRMVAPLGPALAGPDLRVT